MSFRHRAGAWLGLWARYLNVFGYFWKRRHDSPAPALESHEAEFLPAALALQNQPVSPAGRWIARLLIILVVTVIAWSILGHVDIIVNASGKIIPSDRIKTVASIDVASVRAIHVKEGQAVKAGDVLIELDARSSDTERDKAEGDRQVALLQIARSRALISAIDTGKPQQIVSIKGIAAGAFQEAVLHLEGQWREYEAKLERLDAEIQRYSQALPLAAQRASDYESLSKSRDVSAHAWMEKEHAKIDLEGQLNEAKNQKSVLTSETRKTALDALTDASRVVASSSQDARRASVHSELLKLVAPVNGTVQQLTVHTVGGVVPAAQPLMQIVPQQGPLEVEAFVENKDIGFIVEGQSAEVKIDAFEYTKYGTVPGRVIHVSRDAIQDEKKGLIYLVKVVLDKSAIRVDAREISLTPGMSINAEIKTGTRRVIEYVLSPLMQHVRESVRER